MATPQLLITRGDRYSERRGLVRVGPLGEEKDGAVWHTSRPSALKIHQYEPTHRYERDAYIRFRDVGLTSVAGFSVPELVDYDDDELLAIEMQVVYPPFVVDFASGRLDHEPDLIEDEGHTLADMVFDRFGDDRGPTVMAMRQAFVGPAPAQREVRPGTRNARGVAVGVRVGVWVPV